MTKHLHYFVLSGLVSTLRPCVSHIQLPEYYFCQIRPMPRPSSSPLLPYLGLLYLKAYHPLYRHQRFPTATPFCTYLPRPWSSGEFPASVIPYLPIHPTEVGLTDRHIIL
ncbi:uncharacterized protein BJX67DRAFT_138223 [Aspergillus lucknowensis]|uniref:Secreted protein n=1 Tax=Aspergillus lucknowensis TaxID=176173 RepID=A0ABR4LPE6_9EURO